MKKNFKNMPDLLPGLAVFRLVARLGSFTRAADHLGVTASAVSQNLRALESRLGVRLLHRSSRRVGLTEAGSAFLASIDPTLDQLESAVQRLRDDQGQPAGLLRINLSQLAADLLVIPRLPQFLAHAPRVDVELFIDNTLADLVAGGFDAGIRLGHVLNKDVIARPMDAGQHRIVIAAPGYLHRHGAPETVAALADHDCIRFRFPGSGRLERWHFAEHGREVAVDVPGRLIFTDDRLVREAARAGLGLARDFAQRARSDLARGSLVEVLQGAAPPAQPGFHLYYPARRHLAPKLRAFADFFSADLRG